MAKVGRVRILASVGVGAVVAATVMVAAASASPRPVPSRTGAPTVVLCRAAATGVLGPSGLQGNTGATGPAGDYSGSDGASRAVHPRPYPNCSDLPSVCVRGYDGPPGATGPDGATGPKGDTGYSTGGTPRAVHFRTLDPCAAFLPECVYSAGLRGATGLMGDTGEKGVTGAGAGNGASRRTHRLVAGAQYGEGDLVTLSACTLPNTGGRSSNMIPWALTLLGAGIVVLVANRRRRAAL